MGLELKITKDREGEITLTDFTIEDFSRKVEDIKGRNEFLARNVNSLEISGKYSIFDESKESLEVNKLACWSKVTAHEESCYRKLELELKDNNDEEYDSLTFENAFIVEYSEGFKGGVIEFYALIREFKEEILKADGKSVPINEKTVAVSDEVMAFTSSKEGHKEFATPKITDFFNDGIDHTIEEVDRVYAISTENGNTGIFITFGDFISYGGHQNWYSNSNLIIPADPEKNRTGCGSIAAANILLYYAQTNHGSVCSNIVKYSNGYTINNIKNIYRSTYISFANQLYDRIFQMPNLITMKNEGVWFMAFESAGIKGYAKDNGVTLYESSIDNSRGNGFTFQRAASFIQEGLKKDCPVVLLVHFNNYVKNELNPYSITAELHYVVITRLIKKVKEYKRKDKASKKEFLDKEELIDCKLNIFTWGKRTEIPSLKKLWEDETINPSIFLSYYDVKR